MGALPRRDRQIKFQGPVADIGNNVSGDNTAAGKLCVLRQMSPGRGLVIWRTIFRAGFISSLPPGCPGAISADGSNCHAWR